MSEGVDNFQSSNLGYNSASYQAASVVQTRLDTLSVIRQFEIYLRGVETAIVEDPESPSGAKEVVVWKGTSMVNEQGYQAIMQFINLVINAQGVQGNFTTEEMYGEYLYRLRTELATDLMINRKRYGIDPRDFPGIMSRIMRIIEVFMSRPIFNKERDSYAATFKSVETLNTSPAKPQSAWKSMNLFGGK